MNFEQSRKAHEVPFYKAESLHIIYRQKRETPGGGGECGVGEMMYQCFTNTIPSSVTWDVMRMAGNTLHLLVILLAFSNLISLNAAPISSKHPTVIHLIMPTFLFDFMLIA